MCCRYADSDISLFHQAGAVACGPLLNMILFMVFMIAESMANCLNISFPVRACVRAYAMRCACLLLSAFSLAAAGVAGLGDWLALATSGCDGVSAGK